MEHTLRDFIIARKVEIKQQIRALRKEWKELQVAEAAILQPESGYGNKQSERTIKDMIVSVLGEPNACASALEIIEMIDKRYSVKIERTSISPQLSRLKNEGRLYKNNNNYWCLANEASPKKFETPGATTPDVSDEDPLS